MKRFTLTLLTLLIWLSAAAQQPREVILFGHRGSRAEYDENTMQAFKESYAKGIKGFETDFRLTKDGEIVISHDASLKRMTGQDLNVEQMTRKEIEKIRTKEGNHIPFVEEMCEWLAGCEGMYIEFEMKSGAYTDEQLEHYCDKLYKTAMKQKPASSTYLFTSFDKRTLRTMQRLHPDAELMLIIGKPVSDETIQEALDLGVKRLACNLPGTSRTMVAKAKEAGLIVSLWPGLSIDDFILGVELGADALCCDIAVEVKEFAQKNMPWVKIK